MIAPMATLKPFRSPDRRISGIATGSTRGLHGSYCVIDAPYMRTLLPFFACLMLVFTAWSGMAQAAEAAGCCATARLEVSVDADRIPADDEKSCPYQHAGCHGHLIGTPLAGAAMIQPAFGPAPFATGLSRAPAAHDADPALRPPQA